MTGDRRPCAASGVGPAMMSRVTVMTMAAAIERIVTSFIRSHVEHALEELAGALVGRAAEDGRGGALLEDLAAVHEEHAVAGVARERHLVGHHDHRHALVAEVAHGS